MKMRETTQNFLIGIASIIAIGGFIYLLLQFGELDAWFHPRYAISIHTNNAAGLRQGSITEYNGVPIGVVHDVRVSDRLEWPVTIEVHVDEDEKIPSAVKPYAMSSLIGSSAILQLEVAELDLGPRGELRPLDLRGVDVESVEAVRVL